MTTANERYEKAWNDYLALLNKDSRSRLAPFLKEQHVYVRGMQKWMSEKGLSVQLAKKQIRQCQRESARVSDEPNAETTGAMFLPVSVSAGVPDYGKDHLSGISFTFPDGTQVSIKSGSVRSVMTFMKLYQREEALCLD